MQLSDAPFITSLPAHDIERAVRWYEEKLGLTPIMDLRGLIGIGPRVAEHQMHAIPVYAFPAYEDIKLKE